MCTHKLCNAFDKLNLLNALGVRIRGNAPQEMRDSVGTELYHRCNETLSLAVHLTPLKREQIAYEYLNVAVCNDETVKAVEEID